MNRRMIFNAVGLVLRVEAALLLLPAIVSVIYDEHEGFAFLITSVMCFVLGLLPRIFFKPRTKVIYAKDGFITVALTWIFLSFMGSLPFVFTKEIPSIVDAFFETVSGFTTTGSSIITDVEALSHCALFWRSFTHWVGGMGIIVFVMAILPNVSDRPMYILKAETPGPVKGKIVPRIRDTAVILYLIYVVLTVIELILLFAGGMPLFDSIVLSLGTAGTGGFGIHGDSITSYSPYCQWVIAVFMAIFAVNFNVYYLILLKKFKTAIKSQEFLCYLGIVVTAIALITYNIRFMYDGFGDAIRHAAFQVTSVMSTTGYATTDFNLWPEFSKAILLVLMFIGGCAGSTAGGLKVSRVVLLFGLAKNEIKRMIHPRTVSSLRFEGNVVDSTTKKNLTTYFWVYFVCFFIIFLIISLENICVGTEFNAFETNFTTVVTCFNNVGPGFGAVGPMGSFADYSNLSKLVLSLAMLMGRLEIFPIIIALSPSTWLKKQ